MSKINVKEVIQMYSEEGKSTVEIAKQLKKFPEQIKRILIQQGIDLRPHKDAQINFLKGHKHQMKDRKRPKEEIAAIKKGVYSYWDGLSEEEKASKTLELSKLAKKNWGAMTEENKDRILTRMRKFIIKSKICSRMQKMIKEALWEKGFYGATINYVLSCLTFDVYVKNDNNVDVLIDVQNIMHHLPIYGGQELKRIQENDEKKKEACKKAGFALLIIDNRRKTFSRLKCRLAIEELIALLEQVEQPIYHKITLE
jgi:hypothetical protein